MQEELRQCDAKWSDLMKARERLMAHSNVRSQLDRLEVERATKAAQREAL